MVTKQMTAVSHCITQDSMTAFIEHEAANGASANLIRRLKGTLKLIYDYLPEDKCITKARLLEWRTNMEDRGYASATIQNYVKYINRYLDHFGYSEIRFKKGRAKDITGMTFGYLTAIEPTGRKHRSDLVWVFQCNCGNLIELPATRAITGNTLSCGCLKGAHLKTSMKLFEGTSLVKSMTEKVKSTRSLSGYTGVTPKRDKWQAYITYKGVRYSLGCYSDIDDAVKARARGKELVMADAQGLLDFYSELEKSFPQLPNKRTEPKREFRCQEWVVNDISTSAATRSDNTSGYPGVTFYKGKWDVKICYKGIRYKIGRFAEIDDAVATRKHAEQLLKDDPQHFLDEYKDFPQYHI